MEQFKSSNQNSLMNQNVLPFQKFVTSLVNKFSPELTPWIVWELVWLLYTTIAVRLILLTSSTNYLPWSWLKSPFALALLTCTAHSTNKHPLSWYIGFNQNCIVYNALTRSWCYWEHESNARLLVTETEIR